jgi:hypothetical protein
VGDMFNILSTAAGGFFIFQTFAWIAMIYLTLKVMINAERLIWRKYKIRV